VHHGLEYGVPFSDGAVDCIYSSHTLEHLFQEDAAVLLRDAYRALKPGGRLRVAVPDLEYAVRLYQGGAKEQALAFFFTPRRAGHLNHHHFMYDYDLLRGSLAAAGFIEIERSAFREGSFPDVKTLDNRPDETLFVEARK
jgi:predicted SAM-dependent methyltransferase